MKAGTPSHLRGSFANHLRANGHYVAWDAAAVTKPGGSHADPALFGGQLPTRIRSDIPQVEVREETEEELKLSRILSSASREAAAGGGSLFWKLPRRSARWDRDQIPRCVRRFFNKALRVFDKQRNIQKVNPRRGGCVRGNAYGEGRSGASEAARKFSSWRITCQSRAWEWAICRTGTVAAVRSPGACPGAKAIDDMDANFARSWKYLAWLVLA
jgi:hypothetical protein